MFQSRIRVSNGIVTLAVDTGTGELLELTNERTGDNLIKNHNTAVHQPFCLFTGSGEVQSEIHPAGYAMVREDPDLRPRITMEERGQGKTLRVEYARLVSGGAAVDVGAAYEVELGQGECELIWRLNVDNRSGLTVERVHFPSIHGVYLGDSWKDDAIVYPYNAGERIENPVEVYEAEPTVVGWKWQEYNYQYLSGGIFRLREPNGAYVREASWSGPLSMLWMDYFERDNGLYIACYDGAAKVASLRAETFGASRPGMGLSVVHHPYLGRGRWQSPSCAVAVHEGDWHWGADRYRQAVTGRAAEVSRPVPEWFMKSPGLVAHYDFKYQGGGIVHRFSDIPGLLEQARAMGLNHLLLSGWHRDGFDNGFPQYAPDPDLGTPEELAGAVRAVRAQGGHVAFYVNSRLSNTRYGELQKEREEFGAKVKGGGLYEERYGDKDLAFVTMCPNTEAWRNKITNALKWLADVAGADSIYLDQLGMAPPVFCMNDAHGHGPADWNDGYRKLLEDVFEAISPAMIYEGVTDIHGAGVSGQLISTFFHHHVGAYPELYKYTFPGQILVDMLYPRRGQAMRPVHVVQKALDIMDRAFLIGSYYWVYDLVQDNSFDNDPELKQRLVGMVRLRRKWLETFGHGTFRDDRGIAGASRGVKAKRFEVKDGGLLAVANEEQDGEAFIMLELCCGPIGRCMVYGIGDPDAPREVEAIKTGAGWRIPVGGDSLSLIHYAARQSGVVRY